MEKEHLSIRNVTRRYGEFTALHPTSIDIKKGEFFSIIGPSGSGKTTLLGAMAGFNPPSGGQILLNGIDIVQLAPYHRDIGMVFQNYSLFPHMTVAENIAFPLKMRGVPKAEIAEKVERMLGTVKLSGRGDAKPSQLSGGQQQRVALARAAVYNPALLLMDEPLGALDKNLRADMQFEIRRFQEALGATVVYVTHDQEEAAAMSDRIAVMNHGRVIQVGSAQELYERPANRFVAGFLGEANILTIRAMERTGDVRRIDTDEGVTIRSSDPCAGEPRFVCIRPEAITISSDDPGGDNKLSGTVIDAVHSTGTLRYAVEINPGLTLVVRMPCDRGQPMYDLGSSVALAWKASDSALVLDEGNRQ